MVARAAAPLVLLSSLSQNLKGGVSIDAMHAAAQRGRASARWWLGLLRALFGGVALAGCFARGAEE